VKVKTVILAFMSILLCSAFSNAQSFDELYDPKAEVLVKNKLVNRNDTLILFSKVVINNKSFQLYDYRFNFYFINNHYEKIPNETQKLSVDSIYLGGDFQEHTFKFIIKSNSLKSILLMEVLNKNNGFVTLFDVPVFGAMPFYLVTENGLPLINNWSDPQSFTSSEPDLVGFYYNYNFAPGLPPMVTKENFPDKVMKVDSVFKMDSVINFKKKGLYLLQKDTTSQMAVTVNIQDKYFPKYTTIDQLIEPLVYITSKTDQAFLASVKGDKKRFDKFWLDLTNSPERAVTIIRNFYDRVESANSQFTTFKEGWKTDKGMIFIVMGVPDQVEKSINEESWVYLASRDLPKRKYTFIRSKTIFSTSHYVLIRERKHADAWFEAIDLLRKGIFK
jgi:GWxTD domain-containing protein